MKIVVLTALASPYQVELFNAIAGREMLSAIYIFPLGGRTPWVEQPAQFPRVCLAEGSSAARTAMEWVADADLVVFNWYRDPRARRLMKVREQSGKPWGFWGEVLGFQLPQPFGAVYRRFALRPLHRSGAPIWGIGSWAVETYRREFGGGHVYENLPYLSDLGRFRQATGDVCRNLSVRTFLYSGRLNKRKGVDLILRAARQLLPMRPNLRLWLAGDGRLRKDAETLARQFPGQVKVWGFLPWDDLPPVYAASDILVAPSRHDGWNLAVPEGLAAGLPVISTNRTGAAIDLIRHGENGWRIAAGDHRALTGAMEEALEHADIEKMQRAARRTAEGQSLEAGVDRFLACARRACTV